MGGEHDFAMKHRRVNGAPKSERLSKVQKRRPISVPGATIAIFVECALPHWAQYQGTTEMKPTRCRETTHANTVGLSRNAMLMC